MSSNDKLFILKSHPTTSQLKAKPIQTTDAKSLLKTNLPKLRFIAPNKAIKLSRVTHTTETDKYAEAMAKYSKNTSTESIKSISNGAKQWQKKTI